MIADIQDFAKSLCQNKWSKYQTIFYRQNLSKFSKPSAVENKTNEHNGIWTSKAGKSFAKIKQK